MSFIFACSYALEELNIRTISVIVSAILYGGLLSLTLSYVPLLLKTSYDISRRMRNFLLVYVTIMVTISTTAIITTTVILVNNMTFSTTDHSGILHRHCMTGKALAMFQSGFLETLCTMLASWGADGFMLWRCAILYKGVSRPRRIALVSVLAFMALASFGLCVTFYGLTYRDESFPFVIITSITVILNLVTATLITLRILYFQRYIRKTVGLESNSPYMTIISICVESSALIVVFSSIYLILYLMHIDGDGPSIIPMQALVHVYVISPFLIVYRVAQGKAATIRQRPSENGPPISVLDFAPQPPSSSNNTL